MSVEIRRSATRFTTRAEGRQTRHAFSFGDHYDPERTSFGPMVCHDDHHLRAGVGFDTHRHAGIEIVTWVVSGAVEHRDSLGTTRVLRAGEVGLLSAGSGVEHSEVAVAGHGPTRFVQVWLTADEPSSAPSYDAREVAQDPTGLVDTGLPVGVAGARLLVGRVPAHTAVALPAAPRLHVFVARGALFRSSLAEPLEAGDAFCFVDEPAREVTTAVDSELLVWALP
jgi:redox-sensitive bicupin YhaK (pirin superfamily)